MKEKAVNMLSELVEARTVEETNLIFKKYLEKGVAKKKLKLRFVEERLQHL